MANPVLTSVTPETGAAPYTLAPGAASPWFVCVGSDADAKSLMGSFHLEDEAGHASNTVSVGPFVFSDKLSVPTDQSAFATGTPYAIEVDPANSLRFRIRNTNV